MINLFGILKGLFVKDATDATKQLVLQISPSATTGTTTTVQASQTANRTITFPDNSGVLLSDGEPLPVDILVPQTSNRALASDSSGFITTSVTTATELSYLSGATSNIQNQLNSAAINPMTTLGDMIYENAVPAQARIPGNTTTTKQFLSQTGDGTISAEPVWSAILTSDVPTLNQNTTGTASNVTGVVALINGGTGTAAASANAALNALSPMTTLGDMIIGGTSGAATRLPGGTNGAYLTYDTAATDHIRWAAPNFAVSGSINFTTSGTAAQAVTNSSLTITTTGRPVLLMLVADPSNTAPNTPALVGCSLGTSNSAEMSITLVRDSSNIGSYGVNVGAAGTGVNSAVPASSFVYYDPSPSVGSHTYSLTINARLTAGTTVFVGPCLLFAREI